MVFGGTFMLQVEENNSSLYWGPFFSVYSLFFSCIPTPGSSSMASACGGSLALMDAGTKYGTYKDKLCVIMCYRIWKWPKASKMYFFATLRSSSNKCSGRCSHRPHYQVQSGKRGHWGLSFADRHPGECSSHCYCCYWVLKNTSSGLLL